MTSDDPRSGPRALAAGCLCSLLTAAIAGAVLGCHAARADEIDQSSALAHEMDALLVAAADEWGTPWRRCHAAIADLPDGVMAMTQRYSYSRCFVLFDVDAQRWTDETRWLVALHEYGHAAWPLYAVPGGLSEHNPDPASVMASPYRPGAVITDEDRAAQRPYRVFAPAVGR
jgi:hypothetical protein